MSYFQIQRLSSTTYLFPDSPRAFRDVSQDEGVGGAHLAVSGGLDQLYGALAQTLDR